MNSTTGRAMSWNYRIMRHVERVADNDQTFYAVHEVHYDANGKVEGWTEEPSGSPCGDTQDEMIRDLGWIAAGLTKPVLDYATGQEVEPSTILADDLAKMLRDGPPLIAQAEGGDHA